MGACGRHFLLLQDANICPLHVKRERGKSICVAFPGLTEHKLPLQYLPTAGMCWGSLALPLMSYSFVAHTQVSHPDTHAQCIHANKPLLLLLLLLQRSFTSMRIPWRWVAGPVLGL